MAGDRRRQPYTVTLASLESGKLVVRVNGRAAAKPFSPEDSECVFNIAGATGTLSREKDGSYSLLVHEPLPDVSPDESSRLGVTFIAPRYFVWAFIGLLFLAPLFWVVSSNSYENRAKKRVEKVLTGMSAPLDQVTIALWTRDVRTLDNNELSWVSDRFDRWRFEKELPEPLKTWKIVDVEEVEGGDVPSAIVTVEIEGKTLAMNVPERMPISWAETPR